MGFQTDFSIDELRERRKRLASKLESDAYALIPGGAAVEGTEKFRQLNDFYYLCGVEVPHAYLLITSEGRSTIFLAENAHTSFVSGNADWVRDTTGLDSVMPLGKLSYLLQRRKGNVLYLPSREGEGARMSWDTLYAWRQALMNDPFDHRLGRNSQVAAQIRGQLPFAEIRDLTAIIDEMRLIKSPSELALLRGAGELTGLAALAAMRRTTPGVMEYQLHAELEFVYLDNGARGHAYAPIIPGTANVGDPHYLDNSGRLDDGDIVLVDCAPDYRYYTSDIGRMWPINGTFSDEQRSLYGYVLAYHKAVLKQIRPGQLVADIHAAAAEEMRPVFESWSFVSQDQRETARILFDFQGHISHGVGMCVHDVSQHLERPLEPGMVFAVDPMAWDDERNTYYRVEDTVAVTETGYENLTACCPIEIEEIEKTVGQGNG